MFNPTAYRIACSAGLLLAAANPSGADIQITPWRSLMPAVARQPAVLLAQAPPAAAPQAGMPEIVPAAKAKSGKYVQAYRSIPFSRVEYDANPSYRHEAAMELVLGALRPKTIHTHAAMPCMQPQPVQIVPYNPYNPYYPAGHLRYLFDTTRGPYSRYSSLLYPYGGYRLQFYNY